LQAYDLAEDAANLPKKTYIWISRTKPMRVFDFYVFSTFRFSGADILIGLLVIVLVLGYGFLKAVRKRETNPLYRYYFPGLVAKVIASVIFCLVYAFYYSDGGDTIAYWWGGESLKNLFYSNWGYYASEMFSNTTNEDFFNHYDAETGWPPGWLYRSDRHFFVCKVASLVCLFIPGSFLGVSVFFGFISYMAIWKLFETATHHFPHLTRNLRWSILFLPSVLLWCSGIMKDTIVLTGVCWIVYETDQFLRPDKRKKPLRFVCQLLLWGWLILSVKPYVMIALAPAWLVWMNYISLSKIKSTLLKYYLMPIVFLGSSVILFQIYSASTIESEYSPDNVVDRAMIVRNDFSNNETYGSNRYKAVEVNNSGAGLIRAVPEALISGMFRPFIWEARTPFILISAIENIFILFYFILALIKLKPRGLAKFIRSHPFILFSFVFSVLLAFIVGFTSILFGVLIRFRTPFLPFLMSFVILAAGKLRSLKIVAGYSSIRPNQ
jgi:hypothetical protein